MRTERIFTAIGFALVALGIAAPFLPARGMTLNQCKRTHGGYCAYRLVGGERDWEPGLRRHGSGHADEVVPVPVRRIHAVLHDSDPTRWGSPPPPDRFTDRHDAIADRINAVDWNVGRR